MKKCISIRLYGLNMHRNYLSFLLIGLILFSSPPTFANASIEQGNIVMSRLGSCDEGDEKSYDASTFSVQKVCAIDFIDKNAGELSFQNNRGRLELKSFDVVTLSGSPLKSLISDPVTIYTNVYSSQELPKAQYSLAENENMGDLHYTDEYLSEFTQATLPKGYYAVRDSTGLFWAAYLNYQEDGDYVTWDAVDHPEHPWQICSANSYFSRETGCDGAQVSTTTNSIFDGAGSLIKPTVACYGCDKDEAKMHPHQGHLSTVVFQWLHDQASCDVLEIYADPATAVTISAKAWNDTDVKQATQVSLSAQSPFYLEAINTWTTFSVTSNNPINTPVRISAFCAQSKSTSVANQATFPSAVRVDNNAHWMGTGSLISRYNQDDYGINKDVAIGSHTDNALTSFQWLASQSCTAIKVGDHGNIETFRNALVSIKEWNAAFFEPYCNALPCRIDNASPDTYYVIKVESGAGEFPNGLQAYCQ